MVSFTFDPPSDAPAWGVAMVETFKQCVTSMCTEIQTMNNNLKSKFDEMNQLVNDVKSAEEMASSAMDIALAFEGNIKNLQQDMSELKLKYKAWIQPTQRCKINAANMTVTVGVTILCSEVYWKTKMKML